ncbi:5428_t:CDS:10, partial [Acaulospora morrowiae]
MVKSKKQQSLLTAQLGKDEAKEAQENEIEALKGKFHRDSPLSNMECILFYDRGHNRSLYLNNFLIAIFMDDYEPVTVTSAWKVSPTGHEFKLHLWPQEQELKNHVSVDLHVKLPKTYPRSAPDIKIENAHGLSAVHLQQVQGHISRLIKENLGQEMVYTVAQFVQEFITTNNNGIHIVNNDLTSFHEQMLNRIEQRTKVEQEEKDRARQLEEQEREIESMILMQKIEQETLRKKAKSEEEKQKRKMMKFKDEQNSRTLIGTPIAFQTVDFEKLIVLNSNDLQEDASFKSVILGPLIGKGTIGSTYMAQPTNFQGINADSLSRHILILKDIVISSPYYLELSSKKTLEEIEKDFDRMKKIRHPNLIIIHESEFERCEAGWNLHILMEYARGGTLVDLLKKCGVVRLPLAREYMRQLLNALDYIHANSFVHKDIKASNILFSEIEGKEGFIAKLSDFNYHRMLLDLHQKYPFSQCAGKEPCKRWTSPEQEKNPKLYSRKNDIWYLGIIFVQMLFGLNSIEKYDSLDDLLESVENEVPSDVQDILRIMLEQNHEKRPTALELLTKPFFSGGLNFLDTPLKFVVSLGATSNTRNIHQILSKENNDLPDNICESASQSAISQSPSSQSNTTFSRYRLDFEEIDFLGKGAFGEVVKARNKLDGRYYAIKKVRLNPKNIEKTRKILREVTTLSRLHHQYVVRYYTTWFEDSDSAWEETKSFSESITTSEEDESSDGLTNIGVFSDDDDVGFLSASASKSNGYSGIQFEDYASTESDSEFEMQEDTKVMLASKNRNAVTKKPSSKEGKTRILYIQMEYCEKKTLKDIIDVGVNPEEGWRIFRQILEGLAHIHRSGTIHRDLKPSNIFLDANGDVKIGDFGLATTSDAFFDPGSFRIPNLDRMGSREDSLTRDIGTTLYVAPEVASGNALIGAHYNHKVDIYSLGIIFFEICYKFSTEMERRMIIVDLRKSEIVFPKDFPIDKMVNQAHIIRWCLQHNYKNRPTSQELLKSEWLPAKVQDEYMEECIRSMANPNTPYYRTLLSTLFSQSSNKHEDYTYDFKSGSSFDQSTALILGRVRDVLTKIFRHHGAVELSTPLLMPKSEIYEDKKVVYLMDIEGGIVQLPYDLTVPFSRYVSRNNISDLKRYTFDQVYRENAVGGQPRFVNEADFDIVHSTCTPMVAEAEIFKIVDEIIEEFSQLKNVNFCFYVNHTNILKTIFDCCRIPEEYHTGICNLLGQRHTMNQLRNQLSNDYKLPRSVLDDFVLFDIKGDLELITSAFKRLIPTDLMRARIQEIIDDFQLLLKYAKCLGVHYEIRFAPLLTYNNHYHDGIIFQVLDDNNHKDVLAAGGRYDTLMQRFHNPVQVGNKQPVYAIGVNISVQKIVYTLRSYQSDLLKMNQAKKCDVYVASFGKVLLEERLDLVRELWAHNIKADFMYEEPPDFTPGILTSFCKKQGINWIVIIKHKGQDLYKAGSSRDALVTVKVKNLLLKTEEEVPRNELFVKLHGEITEQMRIDMLASGLDQSTYDINNSNLPVQADSSTHQSKLSIYIVGLPTTIKNSKKMKHKKLLIDKASSSIIGTMEHIKNGVIPVLALDVSREILRKLVDCNVLEDEAFKSKVLDLAPPHQKEYLIYVQDVLKNQRNQNENRQIWLYSHKDDFGVLY